MYKDLSVTEFFQALEAEKHDQDVLFIDVRTPAEYQEAHIDGVINIPMDQLANHVPEFMRKKKIYVQCRSGARSLNAIRWLMQAEVRAELMNIKDGIVGWASAGLPLTR
ncbi:MAG: hypothetical protein QG626_808 [Patescibacteria group bacterium]|jgi:rhodanese-related sulfurtransferase|nr:hypothetical protein [Patescibacteria group bacterium]